MIKTVIRLGNDTVMVFNEEGEQIPQYQGCYYDVKDKIMADAPQNTVFNHWFGLSPRPEVVVPVHW